MSWVIARLVQSGIVCYSQIGLIGVWVVFVVVRCRWSRRRGLHRRSDRAGWFCGTFCQNWTRGWQCSFFDTFFVLQSMMRILLFWVFRVFRFLFQNQFIHHWKEGYENVYICLEEKGSSIQKLNIFFVCVFSKMFRQKNNGLKHKSFSLHKERHLYISIEPKEIGVVCTTQSQ